MSKRIDKIKKMKVKSSILNGDSVKQSLLNAGYTENTAKHSTGLSVVKCAMKEIEKEFKKECITVSSVLKDIELGKNISLKNDEMANYARFCEMEGKYLAMFTDKVETKQDMNINQQHDVLGMINNRLEGVVDSDD